MDDCYNMQVPIPDNVHLHNPILQVTNLTNTTEFQNPRFAPPISHQPLRLQSHTNHRATNLTPTTAPPIAHQPPRLQSHTNHQPQADLLLKFWIH
jgi:hypothetical protein